MTEVQRLTWEQYLAGEPCRGCGRRFHLRGRGDSKHARSAVSLRRTRRSAGGELGDQPAGDAGCEPRSPRPLDCAT